MKFKRIQDDTIIEVKDENAIKRFQGYPDLFEEIKEKVTIKETKSKIKE